MSNPSQRALRFGCSSRVASATRRTIRTVQCWRGSRPLFALLLCLPLLLLRVRILLTPLPLYDFIIYWTSGRLFLSGSDPYSSNAVLGIERSLGWPYPQPMIMFLPPWSLPFPALIALMPFQVAHYAWLTATLVVEVVCSIALWRYFGGNKKHQAIALVILATYAAAGTAEHMGQVTPLILAGLTAFLFAVRQRRSLLAGVCILTLGLKPHLLVLVILAIVLWAIQRRQLFFALSAIVPSAIIALSVVGFNRNVMGYYHDTVHQAIGVSCGVGGVLRSFFGEQRAWLSFLPMVFGVAWFASYWSRNQRRWSWEDHLPMVLLVSLSTAPYFWAHDFILALPALIAFAVKVERARVNWFAPTAVYLGIQLVIVDAGIFSKAWMATASLLWVVFYSVGSMALRRTEPMAA